METVNNTLEERGKVYGDYKGGTELRGSILMLIGDRYEEVNGRKMSFDELHKFIDVISKLSRLAASPNHKDSWHDLAGYAKLVEEMIDESK